MQNSYHIIQASEMAMKKTEILCFTQHIKLNKPYVINDNRQQVHSTKNKNKTKQKKKTHTRKPQLNTI